MTWSLIAGMLAMSAAAAVVVSIAASRKREHERKVRQSMQIWNTQYQSPEHIDR